MGLMDREYMHRTPEEREAEYHQKRSKKQISEDQKHKWYFYIDKFSILDYNQNCKK